MKTATIFIYFLMLAFFPVNTSGQGYSAPVPIMNKKLLKDFIHAHLVYPQIALEKKVEGDVVIKFRIDNKGQIEDRFIAAHVSPEIDSSALCLFDLINWNPATDYGIPVESTGEFEISYNIKKYSKYVKARGYDQIIHEDFDADTTDKIYLVSQLIKPPEPIISNEYSDLKDFIFNNMKYPDEAQKLGLKGSVKLSFIIEVNGIPSNIYVEENLGGGCCEESIRILQLIKWIPGIKEDLYVRTKYELTIHFNPADDHRSMHIPNQSNSGL